MPVELQQNMMLAVTFCCIIFTMLSTGLGFPISGTHCMFGALMGAGLVGVGAAHINAQKLGSIVMSWFISPIISATLSCIILALVCRYISDDSRGSYKERVNFLCVTSGIAMATIVLLTFNLIFDGLYLLQSFGLVFLVAAFLLGFLLAKTILLKTK